MASFCKQSCIDVHMLLVSIILSENSSGVISKDKPQCHWRDPSFFTTTTTRALGPEYAHVVRWKWEKGIYMCLSLMETRRKRKEMDQRWKVLWWIIIIIIATMETQRQQQQLPCRRVTAQTDGNLRTIASWPVECFVMCKAILQVRTSLLSLMHTTISYW